MDPKSFATVRPHTMEFPHPFQHLAPPNILLSALLQSLPLSSPRSQAIGSPKCHIAKPICFRLPQLSRSQPFPLRFTTSLQIQHCSPLGAVKPMLKISKADAEDRGLMTWLHSVLPFLCLCVYPLGCCHALRYREGNPRYSKASPAVVVEDAGSKPASALECIQEHLVEPRRHRRYIRWVSTP